jgi:F-type H+-transporting ATPase subunit alpha
MKKVSGSLKLLYSQYIELKSFAQFGSDLDTDTKTRLAQGERIVEVLKQDRNHPIDVAHQIAIIYAVTNNMLMDVELTDIAAFEDGLFDYMNTNCLDIINEIHDTGVMSAESTAKLAEAIGQYKASFLKTK